MALSVVRWLLYLPAAVLLPGVAIFVLQDTHWDFDANPTTAWATIAIVPLATALAVVLDRARLAALLVAGQAVAAAVLLGLGVWPAIAGYWLALDLLLAAALFGSLGNRRPGDLAKATIACVALLFGLGLPLTLANAFVVAWRAETVSNGRPYCIQTADTDDLFGYRPASILFDLSALRARAPWWQPGSTAFQFQFHALLVVQGERTEFLNWSYRREDFVAEVSDAMRPKLYCTPERRFVRTLPWSAGPAHLQEISIGQHRFEIPPAYRPGREGSKLLLIKASGPDYRPEDPAARIVDRYFNPNVYVSDGAAIDLSRRSDELRRHGKEKTAEPAFGLEQIDLSAAYAGRRRLFLGTDSTGRLTRLLSCSSAGTRDGKEDCEFRFIADGLAFSLFIPEPSRWSDAERRLTELFRSWQQH